MVSLDRGESWTERRTPEALLSLAIEPRNPKHVIAAGETALYESADEGRRWRRVRGDVGLIAWPSPGRLYRVAADGRVQVSGGPRQGWREVGQLGGQPAAFEAESPRELYAALHDSTVKRSTDGGRSWAVRSQP